MRVSAHAKQRIKERCGIPGKAADRMAERAFSQGITHKQTKGNLNKWVTSLYFKNPAANNIRLYGNDAYIFAEETLVTVMPIPANLRKNLMRMVKKDEGT